MTERTHVPRHPCYLQLMVCFQYHLHVELWMRVCIAIALNHFPACGRPYCKPAHLCNIPFYTQAQLQWSNSARLWNQPMPRFFSQINPCTDQVKVGVSVETQKASEMFQFYSHQWVSTASRQWTWRDKKVSITVIGIRSATHFPPFSQATDTHTLLFHPALSTCPVYIAQLNCLKV